MMEYSANNRTFYRSKTKCSIWLGRRFLNRTFSMQEDDPVVDVEEIRKLLDEDIEEGGSE